MVSNTALKEWSAVVEALGIGRQLLLLRKGGIRDPKGAFQLEHREFFLYPTWEHQQAGFLRPEFRKLVKPEPAAADPIEFRVYAGIAFAQELRDPAVLDRLQEVHIWTPEFVRERMSYRPQSPTVLVAVRAYRLKQPVRREVRPEYAGCKSWVSLEEPIALEETQPVLENGPFKAALEKIAAAVSG